MSHIRVHLGEMPRMLREMITNLLSSEPDMTVVGHTSKTGESLSTAHAERADIVITQEHASPEESCTAAVLSGAPAAILAVAADGQDGTGVSLIRRSISISAEGSTIADAVRQLSRSAASIEIETENPREA
jgi:DNA-binding NarL/FixJ family response regulator